MLAALLEPAEKLQQFERDGDYTARVAPSIPPRVGVDEELPAAAGPSSDGTPSGIGGTGWRRRPAKSDAEGDKIAARADAARAKGDRLARKALPGLDNAAKYRKQALEAYTEALGLYEKLEERWGMSFGRTIKDIQTRRYQLLKDTR